MKTHILSSSLLTTSDTLFNIANSKEIETKKATGIVLTIGNFDGLHLGHQAMVNTTIDIAKQRGLASAVMVFEPMPKELFAPAHAPARLMNRLETQYIFANYRHDGGGSHEGHDGAGIDHLIIADFNDEFRSLSAEDFAKMLVNKLNVKAVVLGDDFRFGFDRSGDSAFLRDFGLDVTTLNTVTDRITADVDEFEERISSTRIRNLLAEGKLTEVKRLLGRDYCMMGVVQHGDKIGRTLDFPTANVELDRIKPALHGVFAVDVQILDENQQVISNAWQDLAIDEQTGVAGLETDSLFGTANVGTRPAINGVEWRLEVHFPKFKGDLYGKLLKVRFLHFLHGERHYDGLESLKAGIENDVLALLAWRDEQG